MHVLISSAASACALATQFGSDSSGRAIEINCTCVSARICSAAWGMLMRLDATTGMSTCSATALLMSTNALLGTEVTIVGTRASCQPKPELIIVAPAASTSVASATISSQLWPSSHVVGHRHAVADDEVRPDRRPGAAHDLDRKPPALLGRAAPRVGPLVRARREELVEQIAFAAHDLDTVVAGFAGQLRAAGEVANGAVDVPQRARLERVDRRLDRRRAHRKRMVGIASRVQDLQQDLAALVVHGIGDAAMPTRVRRRHHLRRERQQPPGAVRCVPAGDDQADAAARPLGEVRGESAGVARAILQAGVHRPHHHPVAQRREPKVQRRQQGWVRIGHVLAFKLAATSSSHSTALSSARMPPRSTRY